MLVARLFSRIFKKDGIILIDYSGQKYICGNPRKEKPITVKLLKKNLNWKLIINPDLSFPEAYMNGEILIENASLKEFLNTAFKNVGRDEITISAYIIKKFLQLWRLVSNYNLPIKSKKDIIVFVNSKKKEINKRLKKKYKGNLKIIKKFKKVQLPVEFKRKKSNFIIKNNFRNNNAKKNVKIIKRKILLDAWGNTWYGNYWIIYQSK